MRDVVIVGAGISGLTTAFYLRGLGIGSTIVDKSSRPGGLIGTQTVQGCVIEEGPDSFLASKTAALDLIRELGIDGALIGSNDHARKVFIVRNGRLERYPDNFFLMAPRSSAAISAAEFLSEEARRAMLAELDLQPPAEPPGERTVAEFIREHYGQEAVDYLAEPMLAGVYGGDPEQLSASSVLPTLVDLEQRFGSITRGFEAEGRSSTSPIFLSLIDGMGSLVTALVNRATPDFVHDEAERIERVGDAWRIHLRGGFPVDAAKVVVACPAYEAAQLLRFDSELSGLLDSIPYSSAATVALGYHCSGVAHPLDGFGFLVPKVERRSLVACTWVGTKFGHRVPPELAVLRCFLSDPKLSDEQMIEACLADLAVYMNHTTTPSFTVISRWPRSMPQYTVSHADRVSRIFSALDSHSSLHVTGNAYFGVGVPDSIAMAKRTAGDVAGRLRELPQP